MNKLCRVFVGSNDVVEGGAGATEIVFLVVMARCLPPWHGLQVAIGVHSVQKDFSAFLGAVAHAQAGRVVTSCAFHFWCLQSTTSSLRRKSGLGFGRNRLLVDTEEFRVYGLAVAPREEFAMAVEAAISKVEAVGYLLRALRHFANTMAGHPVEEALSEASVAAWREVEEALREYDHVRLAKG